MVELENKSVLILGSQGMAGHILLRYFKKQGYKVTGLSRTFYNPTADDILFDVSDFRALKEFISNGKFQIVVNAVGVLISDSNNDFQRAFELNAALPIQLHHWSKELHYKTILISTDCVFDGKVGAYSVNDVPNANDIYGLSKRLGEVNDDDKTLTVRTSIIGPELKSGTGLWHWFQSQKGTVYGYKKVYWSGVTTLELARYIQFAVNHDISGLRHLSNGLPISKYELLHMLRNGGINTSVEISGKTEPQSNKTLIFNDLGDFKVASYQEMVASQVAFFN